MKLKYSNIKDAIKSKEGKAVRKVLELKFCEALSNSPQAVTKAMYSAPCFLGSEKHFEQTVFYILNELYKSKPRGIK